MILEMAYYNKLSHNFQSRTQRFPAFWSACERPERSWDNAFQHFF